MKMKSLFCAILVAVSLGASAQYGQPVPYPGSGGPYSGGLAGGGRYFALEISSGRPSCYYMIGAGSRSELNQPYLEAGQGVENIRRHAMQLSAVWGRGVHSELAVTAGLNWSSFQLVQYEKFGVDPSGKPRYDASGYGVYLPGRKSGGYAGSLTAEWRYIYNPIDLVQVYSGVGLGVSTFYPIIPSLSLVGIRLCGLRLYGFACINISPSTWLGTFGLGMRLW